MQLKDFVGKTVASVENLQDKVRITFSDETALIVRDGTGMSWDLECLFEYTETVTEPKTLVWQEKIWS